MRYLIFIFVTLLASSSCGAQQSGAGAIQQETLPPDRTTFAILGDSYSTFEGYIPEGYSCWYFIDSDSENDVRDANQTWWALFVKASGYQLILNDSYSGSTVCNTGYDKADYTDRSFLTRMTHLVSGAETADVIFIFGGTNDSWADAPLGEFMYSDWTAEDLYSFRPAYCRLLDYLTDNAPEARIISIINTELKPEISEGIVEASEYYGTEYLLLNDIDKIWGHPSVKGMQQICDQLTTFMELQ